MGSAEKKAEKVVTERKITTAERLYIPKRHPRMENMRRRRRKMTEKKEGVRRMRDYRMEE